jgi:ABC-type dipeptide/oligopeptide/nickel transport system ATPase component
MVESTSEDKTDKAPLLEISTLRVHFDTMDGPVEALHDVNLTVEEGQIMGIVSESGCGK